MSEYGSGQKRVALIMDEVDGMSSGDRGGMQECAAMDFDLLQDPGLADCAAFLNRLIKIIQASKVPILCCCNDEQYVRTHCSLPAPLPLGTAANVTRPVCCVGTRRFGR